MSQSTLKICVIERSAGVLQRLTAMLANIPGVEIVGQSSEVPAALDSLRHSNPDLVIMDAHLRGGIEVVKNIRQQKPVAVVVVLTGLGYPQYRTQFLSAGADIVLDKSNEFTRLDELLREYARLSRSTDTSRKLALLHELAAKYRPGN